MFGKRNKEFCAGTENADRKKKQAVKVIIWIIAFLLCGFFSYLTWTFTLYELPHDPTQVVCQGYGPDTLELGPNEFLYQEFTAMGNSVGSCEELYLNVQRAEGAAGSVYVAVWSENSDRALVAVREDYEELPIDGIAAFTFPEKITFSSGERYCLEIVNLSETSNLTLGINTAVQSGVLRLNGETTQGFLNFGLLRQSEYRPSALFVCMLLLTNVTVLGGLALVLFTNVKEHTLYLILAIGFGIVMLFDLTPLYGFDMRFQFDSTYVVSNQLLGMEGTIEDQSLADPEKTSVFYYRRACDDYSQYQYYCNMTVSDNYVDTLAGLKQMTADPKECELILAESNLGFVGEQLYLYLPQAIGFTVARLLGLGFIPLLQLGRIASYALFVTLMYFAIRAVPFGKRLFLILALIPAVMIQTVSITRDATIFGMSFFLIAKVMQAAYADRKPSGWNWCVILAVSALLAPCKMIYLPLSFLWLLIIYRQHIYKQKVNWRKVILCMVSFFLIIFGFFVFTNISSIYNLSQPESASVYGTEAYSLRGILFDLPHSIFVIGNTFRKELGTYLVNAIQLFNIDLGSSDTITIFIVLLLFVESCTMSKRRAAILPVDRFFFFLVAFGVLLLTALASMQWTPITENEIVGLQGRYLTPILPLLCMALMNNRTVRIGGNSEVFVKTCSCIFPAFYLMNMYLWTITR